MKQTQILIFLLAVLFIQPATAQKRQVPSETGDPVIWKLDNLKSIGGSPLTIVGSPKIVKTDGGNAILFDGIHDGLVVDSNPIAGAKAFTIEAIFRPDLNGGKEQRWLHVEAAVGDARSLLEIRLEGDQWFLDTFIKNGDARRPLYAENFKHPVGPWYHVALVYDGKEMRHYVDGKLELSGSITIEPLDGGQTSLGVRMNRVFWFKGAIRKARFNTRALSPDEFMRKD